MIKCTLESGRETSFRHVTADVIVLNEKNEILLVKRAKNLTNGGKYVLPGGFVDRDETVREAGVREVLEETGYAVEPFLLLRVADNPDRPQEDRQNIAFIYVAKLKGGGKNLNDEVSEISWFGLDSIPDENQFGFDHYGNIQLYLKYVKDKFALPIFGRI
ncbi:MAG TPA: NUDIX hydrolase [Patescibacteria group bacterium]|jgi:ADP-ribose pyrophosphatase YjhB (NUDIX family)|nr:NUDIX hydrolase [Patescibacteria group bacterium]